jgi:hypothetical protein
MKKLKISEEIVKINKSELEKYLSEFEPSHRDKYSKLFEESPFYKGKY